jgi:FkbM family methyltransferase
VINLTIQRPDQTLTMTLDLDPALPNEATVLSWFNSGNLYEPDVSDVMLRVLAPVDTVLDVGANIGFFSTLASLLVGPTGRVVAFEPDPRNRVRLLRNLQLNDLSAVTVLDAAATAVAGDVTFFLNTDDTGGSALWDPGTMNQNVNSRRDRQALTVPGTTIDDTIRRLALTPPKLVKIDTEGAEHRVLTGATALLATRSVPYVLAELHEFGLASMGSSQQALRAHMAGFGYDTYALYFDGSLPKLIPFGTRLGLKAATNVLFSTQDAVAAAWPEERFDPRTTLPAGIA